MSEKVRTLGNKNKHLFPRVLTFFPCAVRSSDRRSHRTNPPRRAAAPPAGRTGLGMTAAPAGHWLRFFRRRFTLLPDREELSTLWQDLVETHHVMGFRAHDVRLAAAMQSYGITRLLTFNATDFRGLAVAILDPAAV